MRCSALPVANSFCLGCDRRVSAQVTNYGLYQRGEPYEALVCQRGHDIMRAIAKEPAPDDLELKRIYTMGAAHGFQLGKAREGQKLARAIKVLAELRVPRAILATALGRSQRTLGRMLTGAYGQAPGPP